MLKVPEKYFHDRLILLILSVNTFVVLLNTVLILLRLDSARTDSYIVQYRANLGLSGFDVGSSTTFWSFILFSVLVLVGNVILSMRIYEMHRRFAVVILALSTLIIVLSLIVTNALLVLR
jgi:hypothetical protein